MSSDGLAIGVDLGYHPWGSREIPELASLFGLAWRFEANVIQTTAQIQANFFNGRPVRPYFESGWGLYWVEGKLVGPGVSLGGGDRIIYRGLNLGAGITFNVRPTIELGLGANYHIIESSRSDPPTMIVVALALNFVTPRDGRERPPDSPR